MVIPQNIYQSNMNGWNVWTQFLLEMHSFRVVKQNMEYIHFLLNLTIVLLLIQAALKETNYTSLLLQTLSMAVIIRVETKFHFRQTTCVMHIILIQIFGTTLTQSTSYVLTSFPPFGLSSSRVIPNVGILVHNYLRTGKL